MKYFTCVFFLCVSLIGNAQQKQSESALVISAVENYFYGYIERDEAKLNKAFDIENGTMKIPVRTESGISSYSNSYFKEIIPKWGNRAKLSQTELADCHLTIISMALESDQMATVKMKMEVGDKTYIDILSLQKVKNNWKITNKMFIEL